MHDRVYTASPAGPTADEVSSRPLRRVVIKEEFVVLTGDFGSAAILGQLEYWQRRTRDADAYLTEEAGRLEAAGKDADPLRDALASGWIYKRIPDLIADTMLTLSEGAARRKVERMVEAGYLLRRRNPRHKWDRTLQYRLDLHRLASCLADLGYTLQGWTLGDASNGHSDASNGHSDGAIPESTNTESTNTESTNTESTEAESSLALSSPGPRIPTQRRDSAPTRDSGSFEKQGGKRPISGAKPRKKIKGLSEDEARERVEAFLDEDSLGKEVRAAIEDAASQNKSEEMSWRRALREYCQEVITRREAGVTDADWREGFQAARRAASRNGGSSVKRINYARKVAVDAATVRMESGGRRPASSPSGPGRPPTGSPSAPSLPRETPRAAKRKAEVVTEAERREKEAGTYLFPLRGLLGETRAVEDGVGGLALVHARHEEAAGMAEDYADALAACGARIVGVSQWRDEQEEAS